LSILYTISCMLVVHTTNVITNNMISTSVCFCNPSYKFDIHVKCVRGFFGKQNIGPLIYKCLQIFSWYTFKIPLYFCEYFWEINICRIKTKIWKLKGLEVNVLLFAYLLSWKNLRCHWRIWKSFSPHTSVDYKVLFHPSWYTLLVMSTPFLGGVGVVFDST
jgi:hypothetical protein